MEISNDFSFGTKFREFGISDYKQCLQGYSKNFDCSSKLENNIPVFLDTNVLLQVYKISLKSRKELLSFFESNKQRLYITNQVQQEFIKNRLNVVNDYFQLVSNELCKDYQKDIINPLQRYYDEKKGVFEDFEEISEEIFGIVQTAKTTFQLMKEKIKNYKQSFGDIEYNDANLELFSGFNILDKLETKEIDILKKEFENLSKQIKDKSKIKEFIKKSPNDVFPGVGDIIEKPDNPFGDYFVYNEILKFMKNNNSDVVFLTFDTTKGDWMKEDKTPHIHYILNAYLNTGRFLYILDAKRTFSEVLNIQTTSIIERSIYYDFDAFKDHYLAMWDDLESGISMIGIERALDIDYFQNVEITKGFEELVSLGFCGRNILTDINELTFIKNCLFEERRTLINAIPISEKKTIINKFQFILDNLPYKY